MTPAEELRAAASKVRAYAGTPDCVGTWVRDHEDVNDVDADELVASCEGTGIAKWIELMSPDKVADLLIAIFEDAANGYALWTEMAGEDYAERVIWHSLALARAIKGGAK